MSISLKLRLAHQPAVLAPGVYDALTALLVEQAGFEAAYVSGASIAYTQLGRPDLGFVSLDHLADVVTRIRERVELPLIVDADTGFGNAISVHRAVRLLERAGATAIQLEDQEFPKRCGHLAGKTVVSPAEMRGKICAALDARHSSETLIVGRTDAAAVEGFHAALARAESYFSVGADIIFLEAPRNEVEMRQVVSALGGKVPLVANMVEGGHTPLLSCEQLSVMGFNLVIAPGALVRMVVPAVESLLQALKKQGSSASVRDRMTDLAGINSRIGLSAVMAKALQYDPTAKPSE